MSKKIRVHIGESEEIEFDAALTVLDLTKHLEPELETFVFVLGEDEPLRAEIVIVELIEGGHREIVHSACRKVKVDVMYLTGVKEGVFAPSVKIGRIKKVFVEQFGIDPISAPDMGLFLDKDPNPLDEQRPLQFYLKKGVCSIRLELATKEGWQG